MARIVLVSAAYWGDVMPLVPVATTLRQRGHEVVLVVPAGFHAVLAPHGLELADLGTDLDPETLSAYADRLGRGPDALVMARMSEVWLGELTIGRLDHIHDQLMRATEGADLLVTHPTLGFITRVVAELRGIPWATAHLFPSLIPSREQDPPGPGFGLLPSALRRRIRPAAWSAAMRLAGRLMYDREIDAYRARHGLPAGASHVALGGISPRLTLVLSSRHYHPRPSDWPPSIRLTGFTVWQGPAADDLPSDLRDRLDTRDPPVVVTMGTSAAGATADLVRRVADTLNAAGWSTIVLAGLTSVHERLADRDDVWLHAPLPAVLAHARAVVHAGGHGTTAATLTAGLPSVVLPQLMDQRAHARRITELGVGTALHRRQASATRLFDAIERATAPDAEREARRLAQVLATEDGPTRAADLLEQLLAGEGVEATAAPLGPVGPG